MITEVSPESWKELQDRTAEILNECGWNATTELVIQTVRGSVEVDVFATETIEGRESRILIECKNWANRVPQNVVHGFRTIVSDTGANAGYLISKAGFQSGAYSAAERTNVSLLTWLEFQELFLKQWYRRYFCRRVEEDLDALCSYLEL